MSLVNCDSQPGFMPSFVFLGKMEDSACKT